MRKDYIYQDKDQFKLLQNATRIGNFMAADKGFVPIEYVLPEQRFAHQPIFRRPPEEMVKEYSFLLKGLSLKLADSPKKANPGNGIRLTYQNQKSISLKNWSAEAKASKYYAGGIWYLIGNAYEGATLTNDRTPVFFKFEDYIFFLANPGGWGDSVLYSRLTKLASAEPQTKDIRVAIREEGNAIQHVDFIYTDNSDYKYKLVLFRETISPSTWRYVQYKAQSLEGPWILDKEWPDIWNEVCGSPTYNAVIQELSNIILSKHNRELSIALSPSSTSFSHVLRQTYAPPYACGQWAPAMYSRGKEGEIVDMYEQGVWKKYLMKRLGNGAMEKTLITELLW